jgi:phosphate acetyltransferase
MEAVMSIENIWKEKVKANLKVLVLPEYMDERTYFAAEILVKEKLVKELIMIGPEKEIMDKAKSLGRTLS